MPHRSRQLLTVVVAVAATLGFVGVSAALEGDDPTLGEPDVTCPEVPTDGLTDDGAVDEGTTDTTTDEGATDTTDEGTTDDDGTTDGTDDGTATDDTTDDSTTDDDADDDATDDCEPSATDDGTTDDGATDDGATDDGTTDDGTTDDGAEAPEEGPVDNHGAAVSQAAHECPPGPEHGPCVREVARDNAGQQRKAADDAVDDEGEESPDGDGDTSDEGDTTEGSSEHPGKGAGHGQEKKSDR
jgi:hypothetical protein